MRRNITLAQALRYRQLMEGTTDVVCLKVFHYSAAQAVYNARKTTPDVTFGGTNEFFLNANQYSIELGRNFQAEDIELARPVVIIGQDIIKKLFPSENPLGKTIKLKERTYVVIGTFVEKGTTFGQSSDNIAMIPITRFFSDMGAETYTVNIATEAPSHQLYNDDHGQGRDRDAHCARPETGGRERFRALFQRLDPRRLWQGGRCDFERAPSSSAASRCWLPAWAS
jgi:putative ABC transport system permease protein